MNQQTLTGGRAPMRAADLHRVAWRWHFYAGLIVLPFLAWLAVTGSLYLFKPEIDRWLYAKWSVVEPRQPLSADTLISTIEHQTGARLTDYVTSADPGDGWRATIDRGGERRTVFFDPGTGSVLGEARDGGVMEAVKALHSLSITGPVGNAVIEIVAGWAIILVLTGFLLWWPRRATAAFRKGGKRGKWRRIHAWTGAAIGVVLLFLAASGLSWSVFWGSGMQTIIAMTESGRPHPPGIAPVNHHAAALHKGGDDPALPWSMQRAVVPHAGHEGVVGPDEAIAIATGHGIRAPYSFRPPSAPGRPYLISAAVTNSRDAHVLYVDPQDGGVLLEARSKDFGLGARLFEWGLYTHMGQQYGQANRMVILIGALGTLLLCLTAPMLWWKRRGGQGLTAPPITDTRTARRVAAVMLVVGIALPLTGLTMLVALAGEWIWNQRLRP